MLLLLKGRDNLLKKRRKDTKGGGRNYKLKTGGAHLGGKSELVKYFAMNDGAQKKPGVI